MTDAGQRAEIEAAIGEWLERHKGRRPTIMDVAQLANVSKKTVSRVLNGSPLVKEDTRVVVDLVMKSLHYAPDPQARGLAFRRSFMIGMIYNNPNPQYVVTVQEGILEGLLGSEYELAVHRCEQNDPDYLNKLRRFAERQKLFGVILTPSVSEDDRVAEVLRESGCRVIRVASVELDDRDSMIVTNDRTGARAAGSYLASLGHKNVAMIEGRAGFRSSSERRRGFEEGLAEHGVTLNPNQLFPGEYTFESGIEAAERLLSRRERPTAVFAANDQMAVGVLHAMRRRGLTAPQDLSVIGYDDFQVAITTWPRLTTIHSPTRDIGRLAATKLLANGSGGEVVDETEPWLVVRESTAGC